MPVQTYLQRQSSTRFLWGGILAVSILCLLAAWSSDPTAEYAGGDIERNGRVISVDMPLHANSKHSLALKRFFNRYKDQPKSAEPSDPIWALTSGEFIDSLPLVAANQHSPAINSPLICLYQLQTLNVPRAPPLV